MTTPPTPADWYPDPENAGGLRYWDGFSWTEHRAPAPGVAQPPAYEPPAEQPPADEQVTSVVSLRDEATNVYATRPVEQEPTPEGAQQEPVQPYDTHPPAAYEPFSADSTPWNPPLPSWDSPSTYTQPEQTSEAPSSEAPSSEASTSETATSEALASETPVSEERPADTAAAPGEQPSYEPAPFETARFETTPYESARFAPPPGPPPGYDSSPTPTGPSGDKPNMKLVAGILGGAAAILVVIAVVVAVAVMRTDQPTVTSQATSSTETSTTSSETTTSETEAEPTPTELTPPPPGAEGSDGDFSFSVAGTETGDTVTAIVNESVQSTAQGMYYVVYLNVTNTGAAPITFVATFQQLNAAGQTFPLDDQATALLEGTIAQIAPGETKETPLVYDVPVDTVPTGILLRADPVTAGVELPLS